MIVPSFPAVGLDRQALVEGMAQAGLQTMLLTSPENVFYTTGYTTLPSAGNPILYTLRNRLPYFGLVDASGETTLLCWGFSTEGVDFGADKIVGFNSYPTALEALAEAVKGSTVIGVESTCPLYVIDVLKEAGVATAPADGVLQGLRLIKSSEEVARLRRSTEIIEKTAEELFPLLQVGMLRSTIMREARYRLMRNGSIGISHLTFSFGDSNPEVEADEPLVVGSLVTLDLGGVYEGYCSDNRRYAYVGEIPDSVEHTYRAMVNIVDGVGAALKPGVSYAELYELALRLYDEYDMTPMDRFTHVGHNIGLETEEEWLTNDPTRQIEAGMVINIELYTFGPTGHQIGNEETYIVTAAGPERISVLPREIYRVKDAA